MAVGRSRPGSAAAPLGLVVAPASSGGEQTSPAAGIAGVLMLRRQPLLLLVDCRGERSTKQRGRELVTALAKFLESGCEQLVVHASGIAALVGIESRSAKYLADERGHGPFGGSDEPGSIVHVELKAGTVEVEQPAAALGVGEREVDREVDAARTRRQCRFDYLGADWQSIRTRCRGLR